MNSLKQMDYKSLDICIRNDGSIESRCYFNGLSDGLPQIGNHIPPGEGSIPNSWSVERPIRNEQPPSSAVINQPGQGTVDGWSYEVPITSDNAMQNDNGYQPLSGDDGSFSGGGGSFGGGGASGSY